ALDCAVLSPTGWAAAVAADGRAAGVVSQQSIGEAIRGAHAERGADAKPGADAERGEDGKVQKVAP
ncbi:ABC transporter ATP-binding protein, partial [Streptomyces sp. ISL-14]|nr:ABC transporter ATP-binding protein [Streptomyces sp. ISL-14]